MSGLSETGGIMQSVTNESQSEPDEPILHVSDLSTISVKKNTYRPGPNFVPITELVARITPENRHEEISTGEPVGNEDW